MRGKKKRHSSLYKEKKTRVKRPILLTIPDNIQSLTVEKQLGILFQIAHANPTQANVDGVERTFMLAIDKGSIVGISRWNSLLRLFAKNKQLWKFERHMRNMQKSGHNPNGITYSIILEALAENGEQDQIDGFLDDMKNVGSQATTDLYCSLMAGKITPQRAMVLYRKMQVEYIPRNITVYERLLTLLANSFTDIRIIIEYYHSMLDETPKLVPNTTIYIQLIKALRFRSPQSIQMLPIVEQLKKFGVEFNDFLICALIEEYTGPSILDSLSNLNDILVLMDSEKHPLSTTTAAAFLPKFSQYEGHTMDRVYTLLQNMKEKKIPFTSKAQIAIADAICTFFKKNDNVQSKEKHDMINLMFTYLRQLLQFGNNAFKDDDDDSAGRYVITKFMELLYQKRQYSNLRDLFTLITKQGSLFWGSSGPGLKIYNFLIDACDQQGDLKGMQSYLMEMQSTWLLKPDTTTFNVLIRGFAASNKIESAMDLLPAIHASGLSPTIETYTYLIEMCGANKYLNAVNHLAGEVHSQGLVENLDYFNALIIAYTKNNAVDKAVLLFAKMRDWKTHDLPLTLNLCLRFLNVFLEEFGEDSPLELQTQAMNINDQLKLLDGVDSMNNKQWKDNDDVILDQSFQEQFDTLLEHIIIHYGPTQHPHV